MLLSRFFGLFVFFYLSQTLVFGIEKAYIVYMGEHSHGSEITNQDIQKVSESHYQLLASYLGSKQKSKEAIFYSYSRHINGFAAVLDEELAPLIEKHPDVLSVFPSAGRKLHTTHSWEFLSLEKNHRIPQDSLWRKAKFGQDIIIANLDTGIWPESASFSDTSSNGTILYGPIPSRWKGHCEVDPSLGFRCNRKLIGAKSFYEGYMRTNNHIAFHKSMNCPRDQSGHGSHTLSTAGGNFVRGASYFGVDLGTAKGGAPSARVAAYKVCWPTSDGDTNCTDADILASFDHAITDGVDVITVSLGGNPQEYAVDALAIGAFHAATKGIPVVCSGGNDGPFGGTVSNVAPWMFTVGASIMDREFQAFVQLKNGKNFKGLSASKALPEHKLYPLIGGAQAKATNASASKALFCLEGTLDRKKAKGKILVCLRGGGVGRIFKGEQALAAGAAGMILCNNEIDEHDLIADPHVLPATLIDYKDGVSLYAYLNSTRKPMGYITPPTARTGIEPRPLLADFSSRGPNTITPEILKPDIIAPGVDIIAAYSPEDNPTEEPTDKRRTLFGVLSGTSMACPHVAGVVAHLKKLHRRWSPAAIKSAIMTTATRLDNTGKPILEEFLFKETPFGYGVGHIQPNKAAHPGLIYNLTTTDYLKFLCAIGYNQKNITHFYKKPFICPPSNNNNLLDFNYPSITVPRLHTAVTVTRRVTNVGGKSTYKPQIRAPNGISVSVEPKILKFKKNGEVKSFKLTLKTGKIKQKGYVFGELIWSDGVHNVRTQIVVGTTTKP